MTALAEVGTRQTREPSTQRSLWGLVWAIVVTTTWVVPLLWVFDFAGTGWDSPVGGFASAGWEWIWVAAAAASFAVVWLPPRDDVRGTLVFAMVVPWWLPLMAGLRDLPAWLVALAVPAPLLLVPVFVEFGLRWPSAPNVEIGKGLRIVMWATAGVAVVVMLTTYDPFLDEYCRRTCLPGWAPWTTAPDWVTAFPVLFASVSAITGIVLLVRKRSGGTFWCLAGIGIVLLPWWIPQLGGGSEGVGADDLNALALALVLGAATSTQLVQLQRTTKSAALLRDLQESLSADTPANIDAPPEQSGPDEALVLEILRLQRQVADEVAELTNTKRRIVDAADDERHRIHRDLHDTVQQRIVGALLLLQIELDATDRHAPDRWQLELAKERTREILATLRDIARTSFPAALEHDPHALVPVLEDLVSGYPGCGFHSDPRCEELALDLGVRRAAYECVLAARDDGTLTTVAMRLEGEGLVVSLEPMRQFAQTVVDRVDAVGGSVRSSPIDGLQTEAVFPCAS